MMMTEEAGVRSGAFVPAPLVTAGAMMSSLASCGGRLDRSCLSSGTQTRYGRGGGISRRARDGDVDGGLGKGREREREGEGGARDELRMVAPVCEWRYTVTLKREDWRQCDSTTTTAGEERERERELRGSGGRGFGRGAK